jgi:tetratricopeptide (TPR) repeat protein
MRRIKFLSVFVLLVLAISIGPSIVVGQKPLPQCNVGAAAQPPGLDLQPRVWEFIADNYLSHAAEFPDPNEPVELLRIYLEGQEMLRAGRVDEALALFSPAVARYPHCRHAHAGLGYALWQRYKQSQVENDLRAAVQEFILADGIGMRYGRVHYTYPIAIGLGQLKDLATMDSYFEKVLKEGNEPYLASLDYARGLSLLNDPRAEGWYKKAMAVEPEGVADAVAYYAEWLLDHGREVNDIRIQYVHFLKGVALERLGRPEEARREYEHYRKMSVDFPAPAKYRIPGSKTQAGLVFEGDIQPLATESEAKQKLSQVIAGEARGESVGGQRAVGWTVRTRVFRAYYVPTSCGGYGNPNGVWGAISSSAPLADRYIAICDAPGQFVQSDSTPSTNTRADEVWYGLVPDPVVCNCIRGSIIGGCCDGMCTWGMTQGAFPNGPAWLHSDRYGQCPDYHPSSSCSQYKVEQCKNDWPNNCFYKIK